MIANIIVDHDTQKVNLILDWKHGNIGKRLTADEAENVTRLLQDVARNACREAFKQWSLQHECHRETVVADGKVYRFKMDAEKEFLTKFGHMDVPRRLYQQDVGGEAHVPLDEAWNMRDRFAAVDVRDALSYLGALPSPGEIVERLDRQGRDIFVR